MHLITHLSRGGWLQWRSKLSPTPPKPGRGPLAFRLHLAPNPQEPDEPGSGPSGPDELAGFDLTEAGTQKRLAVYLVRDPLEVPGIARLGPDALRVSLDEFSEDPSAAQRGQLKGVLTTQSVLGGIGNAYSDEILHAARLSPFAIAARLTDETDQHPVRRDALDAD